MNPTGLMEMAQVKEQEHMREALRRRALREARKEAGLTWLQLLRARLFGSRGVGTTPAAAAAAAEPATPAAAPSNALAPPPSGTPVLLHEIRIRQHAGPSGSMARASAPAPKLRIVDAAELDCVGADC